MPGGMILMPGGMILVPGGTPENPETLKNATRSAHLKRIGEPDEIGGAAVFLASDAGRFVSGQTIVIDGGS